MFCHLIYVRRCWCHLIACNLPFSFFAFTLKMQYLAYFRAQIPVKCESRQCEMQERREPTVSPGPAQILRISGLVNSKTDGENAAFLSELWCDLQKKGWSLHCHLIFSLVFWNQNSWKPKCNACHRLRYLKFFKTNQNSHRCNSTKYSILRINYTSQRVTSRKTTTDVVWVTSSTLPQRRRNAGLRGYRKSYACTQSLMFRSEK